MKISIPSLPKWQIALSCFFLVIMGESTMAQNAASTNMEKVFYYGFALAIIFMVVAIVLIMRKARGILSEHGQPLFGQDFPIFRSMTKASGIVAIVMILLVLWGAYLVITYKVT